MSARLLLRPFLIALGALALLPVANTAIAACRAPQACIDCHNSPTLANPPRPAIPPSAAVLTAMAPATCELGDFSRGRNMSVPRFIHRTAKIPDGRVLLTGGQIQNAPSSIVTNSIDIFNPADNTVSPGAPMTVARWSHAAVTLLDGRVLVTGGRTASTSPPGVVLATAEIYDPVANTWTETAGPMNNARRSHAMTVLPEYMRVLQEWRPTVFSGLILAMLLFRPDGLLPLRLTTVRRRGFWPKGAKGLGDATVK